MKEQGLLLTKYVTPGTKIELQAIERILQPDGTYKKKRFESKVYDVLDEDRLEILMPMEQTKLILLPVNGEYDAHFFTEKGLFQCLMRVSERYKEGNIYLLEMEMISNLQKYQRREYYRYSCVMDVEVREISQDEKRLLERNITFQATELPLKKWTIVDISGGGIRFVSSEPYESGSIILCKYCIQIGGRVKVYEVIGQVLSCTRLESNRGQYEQRVKFTKIENIEREEIIRYIFEEERKKRQRDR